MLQIKNVKVYDLEESVIACKNAMRTELPEYTHEKFVNSLERAIKLVQASRYDERVKCHDNFLTGIRVSFDIVYPGYISPELQRYHWIDIVTSSSKMHRLSKMNFDKCCNKYVCDETKALMKHLAEKFNEDPSYENRMELLSNCPMGLELFMRISTNYKQLQTIYWQRRNHRLKEDWGEFCKFVESLPYANELIICNNQ